TSQLVHLILQFNERMHFDQCGIRDDAVDSARAHKNLLVMFTICAIKQNQIFWICLMLKTGSRDHHRGSVFQYELDLRDWFFAFRNLFHFHELIVSQKGIQYNTPERSVNYEIAAALTHFSRPHGEYTFAHH